LNLLSQHNNTSSPAVMAFARARFVVLSTATANFIQRVVALIFLASSITLTNAYDTTVCCMLRARELIGELGVDPIVACAAGITDPWTLSVPPIAVYANIAWCHANCPGNFFSSLEDWLHPMVQWFAPYTALLFLCPTGEVPENEVPEKEEGRKRWWPWAFLQNVTKKLGVLLGPFLERFFRNVRGETSGAEHFAGADAALSVPIEHFTVRVLEWINILGDPASAVWGAMAQLGMDIWIVNKMGKLGSSEEGTHEKGKPGTGRTDDNAIQSQPNEPQSQSAKWYEREMYGVVLMASQTPIDSNLGDGLAKELIVKGLQTAFDAAFPKPHERPDAVQKLMHYLPYESRLNETTLDPIDSTGPRKGVKTLDTIGKEEMHRLAAIVRNVMMSKVYLAVGLKMIDDPIQEQGNEEKSKMEQGNEKSKMELYKLIHDVVEDMKGQHSTKYRDQTLAPDLSGGGAHPFDNGDFARALRKALRTILEGRPKFMTAIVLPVLIHFLTTAQIFYEAYQKLGDSVTAHNLAYSTSYSWLLLAVVLANSAVASANPNLVKREIKSLFTLSGTRVPLRKRYANALEWECWLTDFSFFTPLRNWRNKNLKDYIPGMDDRVDATKYAFGRRFYVKYLLGQLLGWTCVAFFCSCAAAISYETGTVGIGCRAFNHLLYAVLSAVTALLQVLRHKVERPQPLEDEEQKAPGHVEPSRNLWQRVQRNFVRNTYILFVSINAFVLVGGTIFNFAGVYNNCNCKHLLAGPDYPLELTGFSTNDQSQADKIWNSTGFVAYIFAWCVCGVAVVIRMYTQGKLDVELIRYVLHPIDILQSTPIQS
jgi:hypothetical protein